MTPGVTYTKNATAKDSSIIAKKKRLPLAFNYPLPEVIRSVSGGSSLRRVEAKHQSLR